MTNKQEKDDLGDRFVDLEIRLAHQEHAIEQLTSRLLESDREVRELAARLAATEQQLRAMARPDVASASEETPPPHY